jgi:hypothetical protein
MQMSLAAWQSIVQQQLGRLETWSLPNVEHATDQWHCFRNCAAALSFSFQQLPQLKSQTL